MAYTIKNHKLIGPDVIYQKSPNQSGNIEKNLKYLVVHYTAGKSFERSVEHLCKSASKASAHLVIGRQGEVAQLVPLSRKSWHAGKSEWNGISGLNSYSIGVELDNAGKLTKNASGQYKTWFGKVIPEEEVFIGAHKNNPNVVCGWHEYTEIQLEKLEEISMLLFEKYNLEDILGHDDIAPSRKSDPGPAFPMTNFKSIVMGRHNEEKDWANELVYDSHNKLFVLP